MSKPRSISQTLGIARGAFKKAFMSIITEDESDKDAFEQALEHFSNKCLYCDIDGKQVMLQADFLWTQNEGGVHKFGNIVPACPTCNSTRNNMSWELFLKGDYIKSKGKSDKEINDKIKKITKYMTENGFQKEPDLNKIIGDKRVVQQNLDLLLNALALGLRASLDKPQQENVLFKDPDIMFKKLVDVANKYKI